jgi:hypothetical protein
MKNGHFTPDEFRLAYQPRERQDLRSCPIKLSDEQVKAMLSALSPTLALFAREARSE